MSPTVFIVEDDNGMVEVYKEILKLSGFEIAGIALDGEAALEQLLSIDPEPDIVIMDHRLPMRSGLDVTRALLAQRPHMKVLFVSADSSIAEAALTVGAVGFLRKPFDMHTLVDRLKAASRRDTLLA